MLARAAVSIGLEVNSPPSPEPSQLDDWFLGEGRGSQPRSAPVPFFPEVHEELTKSWTAPFTARSCSSASSILTTLDGGVARGYAGIPQVERAIAVHLCPQNGATWRNRPCLPSKAFKLTAALAALRASSTSHESHGAVPREGDVHHGGPGTPSLAQPGRDEGRRQGTLSQCPHLPGRAVRLHR